MNCPKCGYFMPPGTSAGASCPACGQPLAQAPVSYAANNIAPQTPAYPPSAAPAPSPYNNTPASPQGGYPGGAYGQPQQNAYPGAALPYGQPQQSAYSGAASPYGQQQQVPYSPTMPPPYGHAPVSPYASASPTLAVLPQNSSKQAAGGLFSLLKLDIFLRILLSAYVSYLGFTGTFSISKGYLDTINPASLIMFLAVGCVPLLLFIFTMKALGNGKKSYRVLYILANIPLMVFLGSLCYILSQEEVFSWLLPTPVIYGISGFFFVTFIFWAIHAFVSKRVKEVMGIGEFAAAQKGPFAASEPPLPPSVKSPSANDTGAFASTPAKDATAPAASASPVVSQTPGTQAAPVPSAAKPAAQAAAPASAPVQQPATPAAKPVAPPLSSAAAPAPSTAEKPPAPSFTSPAGIPAPQNPPSGPASAEEKNTSEDFFKGL